MKIYENGVLRDLTPAEISARQAETKRYALMERSRPLTESEVSRMLITAQINTLPVDDNTALRMREFYPDWAPDVAYTAGFKVQYGGKLWRAIITHTSQPGWEPSIDTASMWEQINETHSGSPDDPIPYEGNMALTEGLHYTQNYIIYRCTRSTVNPVYQPLTELVGIYVEEVNYE